MPLVQGYCRCVLLEHLQIIPLNLVLFHRLPRKVKKAGKDLLAAMFRNHARGYIKSGPASLINAAFRHLEISRRETCSKF